MSVWTTGFCTRQDGALLGCDLFRWAEAEALRCQVFPQNCEYPESCCLHFLVFAVFSTNYSSEQVVCTEPGASGQTKALTQQEQTLRVWVFVFLLNTIFFFVHQELNNWLCGFLTSYWLKKMSKEESTGQALSPLRLYDLCQSRSKRCTSVLAKLLEESWKR